METKIIKTNTIEMFHNDFNKMVKKAKKLGYPEPTIDSIVETFEPVSVDGFDFFGKHPKEKIYNITVSFEIPIINGWKVVGKRERINDMIITNCIDTESDLSSYNKSTTIQCEHCQTNHKRKKSVLIKNVNTGTVMEVGIACLKDFVPVTLKSMMYFYDFIENDEGFYNSSNKEICYDVKSVLCVSAAFIRNFGYVSKAKFNETGEAPTSYDIIDYFINDRTREKMNLEILDKDKELADTVYDYFKGLDLNEYSNNNYMSNCIKIFNSEYLNTKLFGYVVSTIPVYHKIIAKNEDTKVLKKSEYVGTEGERIKEIDVVLKARNVMDGRYGLTQILTFKDDDDNLYVSFYSGINDYDELVGERVILTGTVSKHNDFKGIKQTILKRIVIK